MTVLARAVYNRLEDVGTDKRDWMNSLMPWQKHLMTRDISRTFRNQVNWCKKGRSESVGEFSFRLECLASRAHWELESWVDVIRQIVTGQLRVGGLKEGWALKMFGYKNEKDAGLSKTYNHHKRNQHLLEAPCNNWKILYFW